MGGEINMLVGGCLLNGRSKVEHAQGKQSPPSIVAVSIL